MSFHHDIQEHITYAINKNPLGQICQVRPTEVHIQKGRRGLCAQAAKYHPPRKDLSSYPYPKGLWKAAF